MKGKIAAIGLALAVASVAAPAQGFDRNNLYIGGGISLNSASGVDDELGLQVFAGYELDSQFRLLGRLGVDFGDDDGLMVGAGLGYAFNRQLEVRGEYVARDNIDSLQANVVYRF